MFAFNIAPNSYNKNDLSLKSIIWKVLLSSDIHRFRWNVFKYVFISIRAALSLSLSLSLSLFVTSSELT